MLRFTENEYAEIIEKFKKGKSVYKTYSDFLLNIIKNSTINIYKIDIAEIMRALTKIGNNINQIAHNTNIYNEVTEKDTEECKKEILELKETLNKFVLDNKEIIRMR